MAQRKFEFANTECAAVAVVDGQSVFVTAAGSVIGDADGIDELLRMKAANESLQDYVRRMAGTMSTTAS